MSNLLANWWRSRQFSSALKKGNTHLAQELLEETQKAGARLSLLEKLFRDKLQSEQSSAQYEREVIVLREQISQASQTIEQLSTDKQQFEQVIADLRAQLRHKEQEVVLIQQQLQARGQEIQGLRDQLRHKEQEVVSIQQQLEASWQHIEDLGKQRNEMLAQQQTIEQLIEQKQQSAALVQQKLEECGQELTELRSKIRADYFLLQPNTKLVEFILNVFNLIEQDQNKLQCTGIDKRIFNDFEASVAKYLSEEFVKIHPQRLSAAITNAFKDINCLKNRQDPQYNFELTPHVYFLHYFLDNVYCAYLAWFLIYKSGLLPKKLNILDIAAGPGTVAYGIALFLQSSSRFLQLPQMHISYYSLEKQSSFQYRGLQFWRRYIEPQQTATNAYFRFDTNDILAEAGMKKLPPAFFDFIVISHCFFSDQEQRNKSYEVYRKIFAENLTAKGYVLIIVQGAKLFRGYNLRPSEDLSQEQSVISRLVEELGLSLEWYKYITSTGKREFSEDFSRFAKENLPYQKFMSPLKRQHLGVKFDSHYTIDDYVILAKR